MFCGTPRAQAANLRLINNWPFNRQVTVRSTSTRSAGQLVDGMDARLLGSPTEMPGNLNWNVWAEDFKLPTIYQWNVSIQRQLGPSVVVTAAHVGSASNYLLRWFDINGADPGDPRTEQQRRPIPQLGAITYRETSGRAAYRGLETTLEKRLSRGLQFSLAYTWSRSVDDVTEQFGGEGTIIQDKRNLRGDRGNSGFDRRHRLAGFCLVELPFGAGRRGSARVKSYAAADAVRGEVSVLTLNNDGRTLANRSFGTNRHECGGSFAACASARPRRSCCGATQGRSCRAQPTPTL